MAGPITMLNRDSRLHPRYGIGHTGLVHLTIPGLEPLLVHDISYGGIGVILPRHIAADTGRLPRETGAEIRILDQTVTCSLGAARLMAQAKDTIFVGFAMRHETPDTLLFLREFLEPLRCGASLAVIDPSVRKAHLRDPSWLILRGDGPTDVLIRTLPGREEPVEALVTLRFNDDYAELAVEAGRLRTGRATGAGGNAASPGTQMASTSSLSKPILRRVAAILAGAPLDCRSQVRGLQAMVLESLRSTP